jgi:hypothetical protein
MSHYCVTFRIADRTVNGKTYDQRRLLSLKLFPKRLANSPTPRLVRRRQEAGVAPPIIVSSGIVENRIEVDSEHQHVLRESGPYLGADVM